MHDYGVYSTVHLLRQYGFMTDAENHECEWEVKFIQGVVVLLYFFTDYFFFLCKMCVGVLVCECMASFVKLNVWPSASPCLIANKTSRWRKES